MNAGSAVLRIRIALGGEASRCEWALLDSGRETLTGAGLLSELPEHSGRVELVLPAGDVLITRRTLPAAARRHHGALLAYAVEDAIAGDPQAIQVSYLEVDANDVTVLAVIDKLALMRWHSALVAAGINRYELCCETLLMPWENNSWSVAWNGNDGFVRTGVAEGAATDCGDFNVPPLSIELLLATAREQLAVPAFITLYTGCPGTKPDLAAWSRLLGCKLHYGGDWNWTVAAGDDGPALIQPARRWQVFSGMAARLRPALLLLVLALILHGLILGFDQVRLGNEQQALQAQMEQRFRSVFPDAVAVVDPALQMRRQLASARQRAGIADSNDFLPLLEQVALATSELPDGLLRTVSWENGRMTLEFSGIAADAVPMLLERLRQTGLRADVVPTNSGSTSVTLNVQAV
ncbi:MAG: type II secretion system protein GspL [Pseudohongiellaceae bacterium]